MIGVAKYQCGNEAQVGDGVTLVWPNLPPKIDGREIYGGTVSCIREYTIADEPGVKKYGVCLIEMGDVLVRSEVMRLDYRRTLKPTRQQLARDIKAAITELAKGENYPDLMNAVDELAAMTA